MFKILCGAVMADGEITSANIVGYAKKTVPQSTFKILMPQFEGVSGGMLLKDVVNTSAITPFTIEWDEWGYPVTMEGATQIQIPNAGGTYDVRYYAKNAYIEDESLNWEIEGWCDPLGNYVGDAEFTPGVSVWFKNDSDATPSFDVDGAVADDASVTVDCPATFKLRGNPFPVATKINSSAMTTTATPFTMSWDEWGYPVTMEGASQIQIPNAGGTYDVRYYVTNAYIEDESLNWEIEGWCDPLGNYVPDDEIPVSTGIWTKGADEEFTLTFTNPTK